MPSPPGVSLLLVGGNRLGCHHARALRVAGSRSCRARPRPLLPPPRASVAAPNVSEVEKRIELAKSTDKLDLTDMGECGRRFVRSRVGVLSPCRPTSSRRLDALLAASSTTPRPQIPPPNPGLTELPADILKLTDLREVSPRSPPEGIVAAYVAMEGQNSERTSWGLLMGSSRAASLAFGFPLRYG